MIEQLFKLQENQTTLRREMLGGLTTFITMAYIIVVNPQILSQAGMPAEGVVFATCLAAAYAVAYFSPSAAAVSRLAEAALPPPRHRPLS